MGSVVYLNGPETREAVRNASGPMRSTALPGAGEPESQCVSIGAVVINLVARLEAQMNEGAITKP